MKNLNLQVILLVQKRVGTRFHAFPPHYTPACFSVPGAKGVARGGNAAILPLKFLEHIVILCFERRYAKQNSVVSPKIKKHFGHPKFFPPIFFLGWLRYCLRHRSRYHIVVKAWPA